MLKFELIYKELVVGWRALGPRTFTDHIVECLGNLEHFLLVLLFRVGNGHLESHLEVGYPGLAVLNLSQVALRLLSLLGALHFQHVEQVDQITVAESGQHFQAFLVGLAWLLLHCCNAL